MSLSQLRRRVNALCRKLAPELEVARLRRLAEDYCEEWDAAVANHQEPPPFDPVTDGPKHLAQRIAETGVRLNTYMNLRRYLRNCRERGVIPGVREFLRALLPWAEPGGYLEMLRWDAPGR